MRRIRNRKCTFIPIKNEGADLLKTKNKQRKN